MTYSCAVFEREDEPLDGGAAAQAPAGLREAPARAGRPRARDRLRLGRLRARPPPASTARASPASRSRRRRPRSRASASPRPAWPAASRSSSRTTARTRAATRRSPRSRCSRRSASASSPRSSPPATALLAPGGLACIQTILIPDERCDALPPLAGLDRALRLPRLPHPLARRAAAGDGGGVGPDDPGGRGDRRRTTPRRCAAGGRASTRGLDEVRELGYDDRFVRTWDFYLAFCEAAFRTRWLRDAQLVLARPLGGRPSDPLPPPRRERLPAALPGALYRIEVAGAERIPAEGPCILVANHESMIDPFVLGLATPPDRPLHGEGGALAQRRRARGDGGLRRLPGRARARRLRRVRPRRPAARATARSSASSARAPVCRSGAGRSCRARRGSRSRPGAPIVPVGAGRHRAGGAAAPARGSACRASASSSAGRSRWRAARPTVAAATRS